MNEKEKPQPNGGFPTREAQIANTSFRGMDPDATVEEVLARGQMERDIKNAEHFGYPLGTPSREIGKDRAYGNGPKPE